MSTLHDPKGGSLRRVANESQRGRPTGERAYRRVPVLVIVAPLLYPQWSLLLTASPLPGVMISSPAD